ncbi:hypothetical protein [Streptomyces gibsoniae]|uniref:DUF3592 domain-containing protein n=1 Tax=Streptomyces gibsoniae TaxID=3075529 RepID=A0ABU2TQF7_9ACTN|nr:hypothetical protein [Streptomyces sp. DSM 41699]MDT0463149.1 hypothetical protein [Streptomyces sp. DSM 41699]
MAPVISNRGPSRPANPAQRLAFSVLFALIGVGLTTFGLYQGGHAVGLLGEPGRLTVASCARVGQPKPEIWCSGIFRSDDGRSTDPAARFTANPSLASGQIARLDRVHPGSYVGISPARAEGYAALTLFGMALFAFGGAGFAGRTNSAARPEFRAGRAGRAGLRIGQVGVLLLLGAGLCVIIAFLSSTLVG